MARTAYNLTLIRFSHGRELLVQPSPDEVAQAIRDYEGGLTRVLDVRGNAAWINPNDVVSITAHRPRKRRPTGTSEAGEKPSEQLDAELAALTDPPRRRSRR